MERGTKKCLGCTIKSTAVSILNQNELSVLEDGCSQHEFKKGELLFKENTPAHSICYIRSGFVKLVKKGLGKKDFILNISKSGAYLGVQHLSHKQGNCYFSAIAITDVQVCFIELDVFGRLLESNGSFATEVISYIFEDEMNYFDRLVNNVQQQLPGRLANTLYYFRNEVYNQKEFNLNINQTELASLIGTSRESVSRLLKEFQQAGIIKMEKNKITILDENRLLEIKHKG
ncbi:Crp/Fnr family transcriptional regulator [Maribellus maritimus]|uniref:Crp/Fnr family transcriptional regulator n=1 Tax=Maribellus maritimus TaxID=2870838 RepID=UPI001EEB7C41|nr:Crp/Fnr family transcriptional regulator [Maribellus maritimus]MCG6188220.1 Crp/Fnr family transcriptional regulator [Maribellus maritimus]